MVELAKLTGRVLATAKAIWVGGSPFNAITAMWPTNDEGKYVIQSEGIRVAFTNYGAAVTNLWVNDTNGQELDIVLGLDHADQYLESKLNPYLNGMIGRYNGYLSGASYEADGMVHKLKANAHDGTATHNGGAKGWGRRAWALPNHQDNTISFVMFDRSWNGFPGLYVGCVTHTVTPYRWDIGIGVTPLLMPGGPLNLGQQVFWNLDGLKTVNGSSTVLDHTLHLPLSGMRFDLDEQGIPTGNILSNRKGKEHDFWSVPKRLGDDDAVDEDTVYDETFMLSHRHSDFVSKRENPAAILSSPHSGISVELYTDQDALHVHTWNDKNAGPLSLKQSQGEGEVPRHGGISLEQSEWPDSVNHPEWMHRKTLWGSLDTYSAHIGYKFKVASKGDS
ncbi:aldose 1-epimerase family protein [Diplogelasinospora grovesii]|uniref:Aldose 1-epimerase family protein n=1 Tax=Diplogelasinospora grovesii TaxID=303347 RepID=A0AAN6S165_9PEZI|nr:aldose 1-epimerase family protein [Diplogelasinospora grovesii]